MVRVLLFITTSLNNCCFSLKLPLVSPHPPLVSLNDPTVSLNTTFVSLTTLNTYKKQPEKTKKLTLKEQQCAF
jgi:hypothetical protein